MFVIVQAVDYFLRSASYSPSSKNNCVDGDEHEEKYGGLSTGNLSQLQNYVKKIVKLNRN